MVHITDDFTGLQRMRVMNGILKDNGATCSDYISEAKIMKAIRGVTESKDQMNILEKYEIKSRHIDVVRNRISRMRGYEAEFVEMFEENPIQSIIDTYRTVKNAKKIAANHIVEDLHDRTVREDEDGEDCED